MSTRRKFGFKLSEQTHRCLRALALATGKTQSDLVESAVELRLLAASPNEHAAYERALPVVDGEAEARA